MTMIVDTKCEDGQEASGLKGGGGGGGKGEGGGKGGGGEEAGRRRKRRQRRKRRRKRRRWWLWWCLPEGPPALHRSFKDGSIEETRKHHLINMLAYILVSTKNEVKTFNVNDTIPKHK